MGAIIAKLTFISFLKTKLAILTDNQCLRSPEFKDCMKMAVKLESFLQHDSRSVATLVYELESCQDQVITLYLMSDITGRDRSL